MSGMFRTAGRMKTGYDPDQVDEFFTHARKVYEGAPGEPLSGYDVRRVAFDLVRGGYRPAAVDAALDRLERAFVSRQRAEFVGTHGQQAWLEHLAAQARTLYGRLARPDGERFARGRGGEPSYSTEDVDEVCHRLIEYFDHGQPLGSEELRQITFARRRGSDGYGEAAVDAFLDRAVEVLLGVE
ncbi:DivIVA domain-containing protein [Actinotalea sp. M2MS4P-6]|uniref:DivIVA domain-containing protein n=1 Tax=Actinotalea sp. M2MS4P-6 TaxID=2983762 RepID=UPI0021E41B10|nr:DivIVA domain-containing protein [Actinotalea sp. M2MS4P-6]MCV2396105.1 DivIVA domain-containing protein [Actinotalea sp. M2MS4P-6]